MHAWEMISFVRPRRKRWPLKTFQRGPISFLMRVRRKTHYIHMHSLSLSISDSTPGLAAFSHTLLQYDLFVAVCGVLCERESIFYFPIWCWCKGPVSQRERSQASRDRVQKTCVLQNGKVQMTTLWENVSIAIGIRSSERLEIFTFSG